PYPYGKCKKKSIDVKHLHSPVNDFEPSFFLYVCRFSFRIAIELPQQLKQPLLVKLFFGVVVDSSSV
ncbi:MAG: hypothetical protein CUN57_02465, partial [Phototrophicales bacterium]